METTRRGSHPSAVAVGVVLALAGCGTLLLAAADAIGFLSPGTEAVFTLLFLVGWMLLTWAAIVGVAVAVHLLRVATRRDPRVRRT